MNAEIISVGTEITLGQIVNSNARFLADKLRNLDIESHWQTNVDDDPSRIIEAIHQAQKRSELIFVCGGLGPTDDDKTMASVASAIGTKLILDQEYWEKLQSDFEKRQIRFSEENIRQAYYLDGGDILENPVGLALGALIKKGHHTYVVLPGPPAEFKAMVNDSLIPKLSTKVTSKTIASLTLHFVGYPESSLMDDIKAILGDTTPIIATSYVQPTETQVRLTIHNITHQQAKMELERAKSLIVAKLGQYYFGTGDDINLATQVVKQLTKMGLTISAAESLTGGLFQSTLCSVPGASKVFKGGFVTYATAMKVQLLGIDQKLIDKYSVVSGQVAAAMATEASFRTNANIGIGFTGVAGPDPLDGHSVGEVWVGIKLGEKLVTKQLHLSQKMGRQAIRQQSVQLALLQLYHLLRS